MFSDLSSKIEGYEFGMIPLMLAMMKVKKHIDLLPRYAKKEDLVSWKLNEFIRLPLEDQRRVDFRAKKDYVLVKSQQQIHHESNQIAI